jgi:hypothetical protein
MTTTTTTTTTMSEYHSSTDAEEWRRVTTRKGHVPRRRLAGNHNNETTAYSWLCATLIFVGVLFFLIQKGIVSAWSPMRGIFLNRPVQRITLKRFNKMLERHPPPYSSFLWSNLDSSAPANENNRILEDDDTNLLQSENMVLRETIRRLEEENQVLKRANAGRLVLETFEGERGFFFDEIMAERNGRQTKAKRKYGGNTADVATTTRKTASVTGDDNAILMDEFLDGPSTPPPPRSFAAGSGLTLTGEAMSSSNPQDEMWCDTLDEYSEERPIEPAVSFGEALRDRAYWLVGLLVLQSLSGIILSHNEVLLSNHPVIIYFLTMMVGAGGNAGNQASVRGEC